MFRRFVSSPLWRRVAGALALAAMAGAQAAPPKPALVWRTNDGSLAHAPPTVEPPASAPLGSVWKLFVYSYLHTTGAQEPVYRCERVQREPGDEYCCDPGESIGRDAALQRSCGAYFEPKRLGIKDADWQKFWAGRQAPAWLQPLSGLQPATQVPVAGMIDALHRVPYPARLAARQALLPNTLRDVGLLGSLGSSPRFKTWSWFDPQGERWGGAVGWLADGSPFWFGGPGTGRLAVQRHVDLLASAWSARGLLHAPPDAASLQAQPCVDVNFFSRYPLTSVTRDDNKPAPLGPLLPLSRGGAYTLRFANGTKLVVPGQPEFQLTGSEKAPRLQARLPLEDYIARVVDREGDAREVSAARALAIAARSWLRQNSAPTAGADGACLEVDDDTRAQRVSPRPPTQAARAAAAFTAGLVLTGAPIRYQLDGAQPQVMGWRQAVAASRAGMGVEALLRDAFPSAMLAGWNDEGDCNPMPRATAWLAEREPRWRKVLRVEIGYEAPDGTPQVCQLTQGVPHADLRRGRVYIREWTSRDGRVTLIHEYLHLAFRRHPNGRDEAYIERLAQQLVDS
ncbi:MAG TPA: DUF2300 domain-containing protein [Ideonella sp.]|uniref:DUF2300 domain-containing protein n=1 Tax=Ideonella sp. TaxID=1929293 RepID=UPI002E31D3D8|nr:DUF2300 domain-containing protein [Ideonella sp.]HEX5685498.1 DUF2300 domain-containing protein [Ideonella sp.]